MNNSKDERSLRIFILLIYKSDGRFGLQEPELNQVH